MRVLVTGASGFVGRGLLDRLALDPRWKVRAAVRRAAPGLPAGVEAHVAGDLLGRPDLAAAMQGVTHVVHLAARVHVMRDESADPLADFRAMNVDATVHLARAAALAGVRRFVHLSSIKAQGELGTFREDTPAQPTDPYGMSKLEAEEALRGLTSGTFQVTIVRAPLVYGPGARANIASLMRTIDRGIPLPFALVRNQRSLVARANLVDLLLTLLEHPAAGNETFGVSDGEDLSMPELIRRLARAVGRPARLLPVPVSLMRASAALVGRRDLARRLLGSLRVDISKARMVLGWSPPVDVDAALREMAMAWRAGGAR